MEEIRGAVVAVCLGIGLLFFTAGLVGVVRFPDPASRLHALTKADNLGLGFVVLAFLVHRSWDVQQLKLLLIYLLALGVAAMNGYLIGQRCHRETPRGGERGS